MRGYVKMRLQVEKHRVLEVREKVEQYYARNKKPARGNKDQKGTNP